MEADTADQAPTYRSLPPLAIGGLVLGIASVVVFVAPLLKVVPVAAFIVSVLAFRRIRSNPEMYTGAGIALAGMVLAVTCFSASLSFDLVTQRLLKQQVTATTQAFVEALSNKEFATAYAMTLGREPRLLLQAEMRDGKPLDDLKETESYQAFLDNEVVQALTGLEKDASINLMSPSYVKPGAFRTQEATQIVELPAGQAVRFTLKRRASTAQRPAYWQIADSEKSL